MIWDRVADQLEALREAIPGGPQGWRPERLLLRDWWHWREKAFGFAHGRLALTGQNAGGKSSLLAQMLPVLLDGRTEPSRLDPAQSRDRYLHFYLLGPDDAKAEQPDSFYYEQRIGYLCLEFYHATEGRYLTIGMGVHAQRSYPGKVKEWWGFLLQGRRIGHDFDLWAPHGQVCLGRRELAVMGGESVQLFTRKADYARAVNAALFGMDEDDWEALITMLLHARRPKLGEQTGPDKVCLLLSEALPGLPVAKLEQVGEVVDNLEEHRRNLVQVQAKATLVSQVDARLLQITQIQAAQAINNFRSWNSKYASTQNLLQQAQKSLADRQAELGWLTGEQAKLQQERAGLEVESERLAEAEGSDLPDRVERAALAEAEATARTAEASDRSLRAGQEQEAAQAQLAALERRFGEFQRRLHRSYTALAQRAEGLGWQGAVDELTGAAGYLLDRRPSDGVAEIDEAVIERSLIDESTSWAALAGEAATAADHVAHRLERLQVERERQEELLAAVEAADDGLAKGSSVLAQRADQLEEQLEAWSSQWGGALGEAGLVEPLATVRAELGALTVRTTTWAERVERVPEPAALWAPLAAQIEERREAVEEALDALSSERSRANLLLLRAQEALSLAESDTGDPLRTPIRSAARALHAAEPLFRQLRFRRGVEPAVAARVEAALLEAGWLDLPVGEQLLAELDAILVPGMERPTASLLAVLEAEPGANTAVLAALAQIGWGEGMGSRWIDETGRWQNGPVHGQVAAWAWATPAYIGSEAREAKRAERIAGARSALGEALAAVARLEARADQLRARRVACVEALSELNALDWVGLVVALKQLPPLELRLNEARAAVGSHEPQLQAARERLRAAEAALDHLLERLPGRPERESNGLRRLAEAFRAWGDALHETLLLGRELTQVQVDRERVSEQLDRLGIRLQELGADQQRAAEGLAKARADLAALRARLADPDLQRLAQRLGEVRQRLRQISAEVKAAAHQEGTCQQAIQGAMVDLARLTPLEESERTERENALARVKEVLGRHPLLAEALAELERRGPVTGMPRFDLPAGDLASQLEEAKYELLLLLQREADLLRDHRPQPSPDGTAVRFVRERLALSAGELAEYLATEALRLSQLIQTEEHELFEKVIYEGILDELRALIRQAHAFRERTNQQLEALRLSNGERLSLRWAPQEEERVPGARIARALQVGDQGAAWLAPEQRQLLIQTIRDEVQRVRQERAAVGETISYREAVTTALDYRNWFSFTLWSQKAGQEQPVQIRTRGFGARSSSEKAWALAVPVLAAVAARYAASSRADLPRLIGLDEAFAGFDVNNQANYLKWVTDLGLQWVITVPDEVPYSGALSAVMTYRMSLQGRTHTAFPILWDGRETHDLLSGVGG